MLRLLLSLFVKKAKHIMYSIDDSMLLTLEQAIFEEKSIPYRTGVTIKSKISIQYKPVTLLGRFLFFFPLGTFFY